MLNRKATMVNPQTQDLLGNTRQTDKKIQELKKWRNLQDEVNQVYHQTHDRIGIYLEFLDFITTNKGKIEIASASE